MGVLAAAPAKVSFWRRRHTVGLWLLIVAVLVLAMLTVGGLTRLTGSGLSITQWDLIVGALPPLSDAAWHEEFSRYQQIPQYIHENAGMSLAAFKTIFWWEWAHRLLGRLLGICFAIPFLWFAWAGAIRREDWPRMLVLFLLGALQGFIGWWMVQSGLENRMSVSQYRLAVHLGVALLLLCAILWTALKYLRASRDVTAAPAVAPFVIIGLVYLQMLLGALVAGLHGGLIYNTWPSMDGRLLPEGAFATPPWWLNAFENPGTAQFDHRMGAYLVVIAVVLVWWRDRGCRFGGSIRRSANALLHLTLFQFVLGIATLILQAPEFLAAAHQLTAALVLCAAVWHAFEIRYASAA